MSAARALTDDFVDEAIVRFARSKPYDFARYIEAAVMDFGIDRLSRDEALVDGRDRAIIRYRAALLALGKSPSDCDRIARDAE